jgi:hypothetical protein
MKIIFVALCAAVLSLHASAGEFGRDRRRDDRGDDNGRFVRPSNHVVIKMHRVAVPAPERIKNPEHVVRENRHIEVPRRDDRGAPIVSRAVTVPPHHADVMRHGDVVRRIGTERRHETERGRYYWHNDGDRRYCHFYDGSGVHWYGFYRGPDFYWTRYHADRWWWWDAHVTRWVFWYNGYWWWQDPNGAAFVYVDNNYYPYEAVPSAVTVKAPEVQAPASSAPPTAPTASADHSWKSPDGSREILTAAGGEAFLFDSSSGQAVFVKYIGRGVEKAKFTNDKDGKPLRILVEFEDGNFALFDANGQSLDVQPDSPASAELPGPPPVVTPPSGSPTAPPTP